MSGASFSRYDYNSRPVANTASVQRLVRRRTVDRNKLALERLGRRRVGAGLMGAVALLLVYFRRMDYDSLAVMSVEALLGLTLIGLIRWLPSFVKSANPSDGQTASGSSYWLSYLFGSLALATPFAMDSFARKLGMGNGFEIVLLTAMGWGAILIATLANNDRNLGMSVVCSGFLTLFCTFISDSSSAVSFAFVWGLLCLWWLVSNHWEQIESHTASKIEAHRVQRLVLALVGVLFVVGAAFAVNGRLPVLYKLTAELMPTSGGTSGKDSAARRGVGNGDALIAAKSHATSFGAVDTDLFLDSEKPSLFDVFSDEFGETVMRKDKFQKAQALSPNEIQSQEGSFTEANKGSGEDQFSTDRELPDDRKPTNNLASDALMFWDGAAGAHLAVQRFEHFDGVVWSNLAAATPDAVNDAEAVPSRFHRVPVGDQIWYAPSMVNVHSSISPFVDALPEAVKFTKYGSSVVPTRAGLQLWSIDKIDRDDFFCLSDSQLLSLTGRDSVPEYTVVRMINSRVDLDRFDRLLKNCSPGRSHFKVSDSCRSQLNALAHRYVQGHRRGWQQVSAVIEGLRREFTLDRTATFSASFADEQLVEATPLDRFVERRCGPSYLFATAACHMLRHLGYETRFVTGFYANPRNYLQSEQEYAVLAADAHTWLEINAGHGYWVPLEPTPGFEQPQFKISYVYWLYLHRWSITYICSLCGGVVVGLYASRKILFDILALSLWPVVSLMNERWKIAWLSRLVDLRFALAGMPRKPGVIPRVHQGKVLRDIPSSLRQSLQLFHNSADRMWFGSSKMLSKEEKTALKHVWLSLTTVVLRRHRVLESSRA